MQPGHTPLFCQRFLKDLPELQASQPTPEPPPPAHERKPRGVLFWVRQVFLFPFRLMGLLLLLVLIVGGIDLWRLPTVAQQNDLELALVALRTIDHEKSARPLAPLGYQRTTQAGVIDLCPPNTYYHLALSSFTANFYNLKAVATSAERTPDGRYRYCIQFNHCEPRMVEATTPHLNVGAADLAEARAGIARLFKDRQQWREVLEWGESLFWTEWIYQNPLSFIPKQTIPKPWGGTEDERLWLAWQVLRGSSAEAGKDLFRLPELFREAFPRAEDRAAALKWTQGLYDRLEADFAAYQGDLRPTLESTSKQTGLKIEAWEDGHPLEQIHAGFKRVLPPKTEWTHLWLLYRYAGLTEASRAAARGHWLSRFPEGSEEEVRRLGGEIADERRAAEEPLPPVADTLPLVCVAERLVGSDPYGQRCRGAVKRGFGSDTLPLRFTIMSAYPNDEMFYLLASKDGLHMHPIPLGAGPLGRLARVAGGTTFPLMASLAVATLLYWVVVPLLMPRRARPLWQKHLEGRAQEPLWQWACSVVVFAALGALLAPLGLPDAVAVQMDASALFLGSLAATAVGGVLIGTFRRILAVMLIACGVDVETTWIDEALGILIGAFVLYHFGNDLLAIALYALSDLAPAVVEAMLHRWRAHPSPRATSALQGASA